MSEDDELFDHVQEGQTRRHRKFLEVVAKLFKAQLNKETYSLEHFEDLDSDDGE